MNLDDLLQRYFATGDPGEQSPQVLAAGLERIHVDFGLEKDSAKRFALWCVLYMFDDAPALDVAFEDETERDAARNFMDLMAATDDAD
ncbi:MAG: hypothetical protein ABGW87_10565 [Sphingomonadaceae bacterium]